MVEGYCIKCRCKQEMKNLKACKSKKGTPMIKGVCTSCGTKMCKMGGA